jgi:WD40 repeat protein
MSDTQVEHPEPNELNKFGLGQLAADASRTIEIHLETCSRCRGLLEAQADDSLVMLLRSSLGPPRAAAMPDPHALTLPFAGSAPLAVSGCAPCDIPVELAGHSRYRILEVLGTGGMGTVYRAQHLLMEREVALKVINRGLMGSANLVERFRREVKWAARLSHPNIVTAHDADQAGDWHFLVMEYVQGISLSRLVTDNGRLPVVAACDYARQAALGLQHAFERGMVHRDIKPQNLMLTPAGQVKILDFGLSRLGNEAADTATIAQTVVGTAGEERPGESLTLTGCVMGTPDYIAPEQICNAHTADIRADIYSLGCTLYFLLTGTPPFAGKTDSDKVASHLGCTPRPLAELRPEVPARLAAVVARMMARSPQERYQTPAEVAEALAPSAGVAPSARPRQAGLLAALVLLLLVTGMGVVAITARLRHRAAAQPSGTPTPAGQVVVECPEKAGLLVFRKDGRNVHVLDLQNGSSCRIEPGCYDLSLTNATDHLYLPVERCQVTEGTPATIRVRKVELVREFPRLARGDLVCAVFTPDGKRVLVGGRGNTLRMWDVATGKELLVFPTHKVNDVFAVVLSPDGRTIAWGAGSQIVLSDLQTGSEIGTFEGHQGTLFALAFSPDGTHLLSGAEDRTMRLWDVKSRQQLKQFSLTLNWDNVISGEVWSVAFTPDGLYAVTARHVRNTNLVPLQFWNLSEGIDEHRLDDSRGTFDHVATLSPDGCRVLAGCSEKITLWDLETGKEIQRFTGHKSWMHSVAFLPNGRHILSGSHDGTARVWDIKSGRQLYCFTRHKGAIRAAVVAPDGCHALTVGDDRVACLWRMPVPDPLPPSPDPTGELFVQSQVRSGLLLIQKDGRHVRTLDLQAEHSCRLKAGDYDFSLANAPADAYLLATRCHVTAGANSTIRIDRKNVVGVYKGLTRGSGVCVAITPDGKQVLSGGWSNALRRWDVATCKELHGFDCPGANKNPNTFAVALSPDGRSIAWGADTLVVLSNLESGAVIHTFKGHTGTVWGVSFSPDGARLLSVARDGTMRLWDVQNRKQLDVFSLGHYLASVAFTPDGQHALVTLGSRPNERLTDKVPLLLWDLKARRDLHRFDASRNTEWSVATVSNDGRRVLAGSDDRIMRLWDLQTGTILQRFVGHSDMVRNVAFLPGERRVLSVSYDRTAKVWDVASGKCLYTFTRHRDALKGVAIDPDGRHAFTVAGDGLVIRWRLPPPEAVPRH